MKPIRRQLKALSIGVCLCIVTLSLSGCWNRRELNSLAPVAGLGVDAGETPGTVSITVQIVDAGKIQTAGGNGGGGTSSSAVTVVTRSGRTLLDAVRSMTEKINSKLYFPHNQIVVFGSEVAKQGIRPHFDILIRNNEVRLTNWILLAKDTAKDVLGAKAPTNNIPASGIANRIVSSRATSYFPEVTLHDFNQGLLRLGGSSVVGCISASDDEVRLAEAGVFKDGRLVGFLNRPETRGYLWIVDKVKSGIIVIDCPDSDESVDLEIFHSKTTMSPKFEHGQVTMEIAVHEEGAFDSQQCGKNLSTPEGLANLRKRQSQAIRDEIDAAWRKARKLNADIFGFGEAVYRKYPKQKQRLQEEWDTLFPRIQLNVEVVSNIRTTGLSLRTPIPPK